MTKKTIENFIENRVLETLEDYLYMKTDDVIELFEKYCETSDDLDEILDIAFNSKLYNYVVKQNGNSYIFSKNKKDKDHILGLFYQVEFADNDPVWDSYVSYDGDSMTFSELFNEVNKVCSE